MDFTPISLMAYHNDENSLKTIERKMYWKNIFYFFLKCYYCLLYIEACSSSGNGMPERIFPISNCFLHHWVPTMLVQPPPSNIVAVRAIWAREWKDDYRHKFTEKGKSKGTKSCVREGGKTHFSPQMKLNCVCFIIAFFFLVLLLWRHMLLRSFVGGFSSLSREQYFRQHKISIYDKNDNGKIIESDKKIYCVTTFFAAGWRFDKWSFFLWQGMMTQLKR